MSISRDLSTPENHEYWKFVAETAKEVAAWPAWKRGERLTMSIGDEELHEWQSYNRAVHECPDRMAEEIFRLRHDRSELARELLAARAAISQYTDLHEDCEHKDNCPCSMCAYIAKYGEPGGGE